MDLKELVKSVSQAANKYQTKEDRVNWAAWQKDGSPRNTWGSYGICYSQAMDLLPTLEIHCLPWEGPAEGQMPSIWYYYFFRLLKQYGLVVPEAKVLHRNKAHCLIIPPAGWDRHTVYITLCYYRQCDQRPNEVMKVLLLYDKLAPEGTHFLQCMHYLAMTTGHGSGHYFMDKGPYGGGCPKNDLANGQALAWFAGLPKKQRLDIYSASTKKKGWQDNFTYTLLGRKSQEMKSIKVEELEEILDPQYAYLYEEAYGSPSP